MGNIMEKTFLDIWNGTMYRKLREDLFTGNDDQCQEMCLAIEAGDPNNPQSIFRQ